MQKPRFGGANIVPLQREWARKKSRVRVSLFIGPQLARGVSVIRKPIYRHGPPWWLSPFLHVAMFEAMDWSSAAAHAVQARTLHRQRRLARRPLARAYAPKIKTHPGLEPVSARAGAHGGAQSSARISPRCHAHADSRMRCIPNFFLVGFRLFGDFGRDTSRAKARGKCVGAARGRSPARVCRE